jgi:integrase
MAGEIRVIVVKFPDGRANLMLRYVDPITHKQKHKSAGTANKRDAEKAAGKWESELREGRYVPPCRMSWEDFRDRYEREALPMLARRTAEPRAAVMGHVERILSPRRISDLTPERLSFFQAELRKPDPSAVARAEAALIEANEAAAKAASAGSSAAALAKAQRRVSTAANAVTRAKRPKSEATVKGNLAHLRSILQWAVRVKIMRAVPDIQMPTRNLGGGLMRGRPVTGEEFDRLLDKVAEVRPNDAERWRRYLTGLWLSGLRLEESLRFTWDQDGCFTVDVSGRFPRIRIYAEAEKGNKDRLLPMTPDFAEWLLQTPPDARCGRVFDLGDRPGRQRSAKRVSRAISEIGARAGVVVNYERKKFASAHDLRRSFGTRWAPRVKPATLQLLMRHSSIDTTLRYYVAQDADDVAAELWREHAQFAPSAALTNSTIPVVARPEI